ncbi:MAG: hypothetical protein K0B15_03660 [Lentimicrobium sp.]|nr:hypothetical protein [Lentimicrobium sp.]
MSDTLKYLLAVDAGIRTGLALFDRTGKLVWYRSHNMGSISSLRKAVYTIINSVDCLDYLVVEGGGPITSVWLNTASKLGIKTLQTDAGIWRKELLFKRRFRNSGIAKESAIQLANQIIHLSEAPSYNPPTHDAAEAILIGLWGCKKINWIEKYPLLH